MAFIQATFIQGYYSYLHNASTVLHPDGERMGACPGKGTAFMWVSMTMFLEIINVQYT